MHSTITLRLRFRSDHSPINSILDDSLFLRVYAFPFARTSFVTCLNHRVLSIRFNINWICIFLMKLHALVLQLQQLIKLLIQHSRDTIDFLCLNQFQLIIEN